MEITYNEYHRQYRQTEKYKKWWREHYLKNLYRMRSDRLERYHNKKSEKMETQNKELLMHFMSGLTITSLSAINLFGITRLSGRIYDLRRQGYDVQDTWKEVVNRHGKKCRVKEYFLKKSVFFE